MKMKTQRCTAATLKGRLAQAIEFFDSAESQRERYPARANAWVTHFLLAGIAAADVVCCRALGRHAHSENHSEALSLLRTVRPDGPELATALGALLAIKTMASYGERPVSREDRTRAPRRARQLLDAALQRV